MAADPDNDPRPRTRESMNADAARQAVLAAAHLTAAYPDDVSGAILVRSMLEWAIAAADTHGLDFDAELAAARLATGL